MFIAIDIGNTHSVIGIYKKDTLLANCRLASTLQWTEDEIFAKVHSSLVEAGTTKQKIDGIGISSVVPSLTNVYSAMVKKYFHKEPMIISSELSLGITIHYDNPDTLGSDRICNAIAGYSKYGGPLIIIDFGTATTYDVIASNGDFLGGVIAPGIETSAISLHKRTAKLPRLIDTNLHLPHRSASPFIACAVMAMMGRQARRALESGMNQLVDAVKVTLGPKESRSIGRTGTAASMGCSICATNAPAPRAPEGPAGTPARLRRPPTRSRCTSRR